MRDEAGEAADLSSAQRPDFRQEGQDRGRGDLAEPGNRAQDVALACLLFIGLDEVCDLRVQLSYLFFDQREADPGLALEYGACLNVAAIAQPGALLDQGRSGNLEVPEYTDMPGGGRVRLQRQRQPHAGKAAGIQCIGLRPGSAGFGKPSRPLFVEVENIKVGFGNIHANGMICHLRHVLKRFDFNLIHHLSLSALKSLISGSVK